MSSGGARAVSATPRRVTSDFRFCILALAYGVTPTPPAAVHPPAHVEHTNRLAHEKSPYLLQHAHNPVDWYPWGEEAFDKAQTRGQADLSLDRLFDLPLVPRDGARIVRERGRSPRS